MKSFMKTAAILGTCFFMAGAFAEGSTTTGSTGTTTGDSVSGTPGGTSDNYNADMRNPQNTDTTRSPSSNVPSADNSTTDTDTYSQGTGITTTDDSSQAMDDTTNSDMSGMNAMNSKSQIKNVQSALSSRGYDVAVDGVMGKNTKNAISRFQRDQGLTESGRIDDATLRALNLGTSDRVPASVDDTQMGD